MVARINAQTVNSVNAYCGNPSLHSLHMGKRTEADPSPFWVRMATAWKEQHLSVTQNGVATKLHMSQGSTRRWFTGDGKPETETIIEIARLGKVTVDWLLTGQQPMRPVPPGSQLEQVLVIWEQLNSEGREHVLHAAQGQLALIEGGPVANAQPAKSGARRRAA